MEKIRNVIKGKSISGYITAVVAGVTGTLGSACVQKLGDSVPPFQLNTFRYIGQIILALGIFPCYDLSLRISSHQIPTVLLISVLTTLNNALFFTAAEYLPLGNLMVLYVTGLYIAAVIFSKIFSDKNIYCIQSVCFVLIVIGQFLLMQPSPPFPEYDAIMTNRTNAPMNSAVNFTSDYDAHIDESSHSALGFSLIIGASVISALRSHVCKEKTDGITTTVLSFWIGIIGTGTSFLLSVYLEEPVVITALYDILLVFGHVVFAAANTMLVTHAQQVLHPVIYSVLQNSNAVCGFILQYAFPQVFMPGKGNLTEMLGALTVVLGILMFVIINFKIEKLTSIKIL